LKGLFGVNETVKSKPILCAQADRIFNALGEQNLT